MCCGWLRQSGWHNSKGPACSAATSSRRECPFILCAMLLVHYNPQVSTAESWGRERPKSKLAVWSGETGRNHTGPADCTRGPEQPVGTVALGVLLLSHPGPRQTQERSSGGQEPQALQAGHSCSSQTGASPASSSLPPPPSAAIFFPSFSPCDTS